MWLGGVNGTFLKDDEIESLPAIAKLGQQFTDFQNSLYRGEWNQNHRMSFGEVRDVLIEVARLVECRRELKVTP